MWAMTPALRTTLRSLLVAGGIATTAAGVATMQVAEWPIYLVYVVLSLLLFPLVVEVIPGLGLPMPGLALSLGFLYIGGLPIVALRNLALPAVAQVLRIALPERWWLRVPVWSRTLGIGSLVPGLHQGDRMEVAADWSMFAVGMGARWAIASAVAGPERPAGDLAAMALAELGGYACWGACSALPILSFPPVASPAGDAPMRAVQKDLGLVMVLLLTPFVFLIAYGYRADGLTGAAGWSCASLGLHVVVRRLNERRVRVEEQHRRLETLSRELAHRERLSAIGKTSSVLSHQILQQLGVIGIQADLIRHQDAGGDPARALAAAREHAGAIEQALRGVDRVLRDVLVFSRDPRLNLYEHDVAAVARECVDECRAAAAARGVGIVLRHGANGTAVFDKLKVKQVLANVLRNAVEASPAGGEVQVTAETGTDGVRLAVADRGPGVPPDERERIFAPFYTTKEHGTGLGLAIARELAAAHGGSVAVVARDGGGTVIEIRLPAAAAPPPPP